MSERYVVMLTRDEALKLGIVFCASCGYPPNNHFDFGKRQCAHTDECTGYVEAYSRGKTLVSKARKNPR